MSEHRTLRVDADFSRQSVDVEVTEK
jgi:hypothetical protein